MSDESGSPAGAGLAYTVPTRPDGWPDLLGRRPPSAAERARLRATLHQAAQHGAAPAATPDPDPGKCSLTISGLDRAADPARATRLRGRIHAALRTAAERCRTTYQATEATITIGIIGPDAAACIGRLRAALGPLAAKHGWKLSEAPADGVVDSGDGTGQ
ncbi:hypothetical protein AB0J35_59510 [Nonomuraea angiospora]|uniref:hypothetical protein n=1 Tax=Nonomuraea angiospora TaxID=46172 RepID=UPI00342D83FB